MRYLPLLLGWCSGQALIYFLGIAPGKQVLDVCANLILFTLFVIFLLDKKEKK